MKLLLYCTKAKPYLIGRKNNPCEYYLIKSGQIDGRDYIHNGKIVGECDFEVDRIVMQKGVDDKIYGNNGFIGYALCNENSFEWYFDIEKQTCLSEEELFKYLEGFEKPYLISSNYKCKNGYAIYIKNLKIFDEPKELNELYSIHDIGGMLLTDKLKKAPQNMQRISLHEWVYGTFNPNDIAILISIRPKWLCKILNGEKTIEIRKKVLKGMIENDK